MSRGKRNVGNSFETSCRGTFGSESKDHAQKRVNRMRKSRRSKREFKFRFGQRVRVRLPSIDAGATGRVINGQLYPDGKETYSVDVPGGSWHYEAHQLEDADD